MKVHELIEQLKAMPQDAVVITNGYEGGYQELQAPEVKRVALNYHGSTGKDCYGDHEDVVFDWQGKCEHADAVYLEYAGHGC